MVEICKLVEGRMTARERRGSREQEWVERYQLPHVQLTLPENARSQKRPLSEGIPPEKGRRRKSSLATYGAS